MKAKEMAAVAAATGCALLAESASADPVCTGEWMCTVPAPYGNSADQPDTCLQDLQNYLAAQSCSSTITQGPWWAVVVGTGGRNHYLATDALNCNGIAPQQNAGVCANGPGEIRYTLLVGGGPVPFYETFTAPVNTLQFTISAVAAFTGTGGNVGIEVFGENYVNGYSRFQFDAQPIITDEDGNQIVPAGSCFGHIASWCSYYNPHGDLQERKVSAAAIPTVAGRMYTITVQGAIWDNVTPSSVNAFNVQLF